MSEVRVYRHDFPGSSRLSVRSEEVVLKSDYDAMAERADKAERALAELRAETTLGEMVARCPVCNITCGTAYTRCPRCNGLLVSLADAIGVAYRGWVDDGEPMPTCERCGEPPAASGESSQ